MGMVITRTALIGWFSLVLVFFPFSNLAWTAAPAGGVRGASIAEAALLSSIARWLRRDGHQGWLGTPVADAMGIPRLATDEPLEARQRGFRDDQVLRIAQVSADERHDFLLFMVQRPDEVFFYHASVRDGLKGAFVSIPASGLVKPIERAAAEIAFEREVRFWEGRVVVR